MLRTHNTTGRLNAGRRLTPISSTIAKDAYNREPTKTTKSSILSFILTLPKEKYNNAIIKATIDP